MDLIDLFIERLSHLEGDSEENQEFIERIQDEDLI